MLQPCGFRKNLINSSLSSIGIVKDFCKLGFCIFPKAVFGTTSLFYIKFKDETSGVAECPFSDACSYCYRKLNSAASLKLLLKFLYKHRKRLNLSQYSSHVPNTYILKTSTQQKLCKEFLFDILKTQHFKFHYRFLDCVSQFCKDQVLVLNWGRLHWDESIVSLLVSACSLLKSRKFCLKKWQQTKKPHPAVSGEKRPLSGGRDRTDFPSKPTRGLRRCKRSW